MDDALDLGEHKPLSEVGPTRSETGAKEDGRGLSSIEQEHEALRWMMAQAEKSKTRPRYVEARILWALRKPTTLRVQVAYETAPTGPKVATVLAVVETDEDDKVIERSATRLIEEMRREAPRLGRRG